MLQTILYVLFMLIGFGALIFIHELGHFVAAKWAGIRTEAFAVGMGPVAIAWRKGIGIRFGSTAPEYERRVRESLDRERDQHLQMKEKVAGTPPSQGELPRAEFYRIGDKLGIGETEYSLRWLPIGGFVKMLGQEDANPNYVSDDPRSYNMRPIGKRMVVVSAGVIMNLILAIVLFVIAFMAGVRFPAPVIGEVVSSMPAGLAVPTNAAALGIETPGLRAGDRVLTIDGEPTNTFADIHIAAAMSRPGTPLEFRVQRSGVSETLQFNIVPQKDPAGGLLSIGVSPGTSTTLIGADVDQAIVEQYLTRTGLAEAGVKPGMTLTAVNGTPISTYGELARLARQSDGQPLRTIWTMAGKDGDRATTISYEAALRVTPELETYRSRTAAPDEGLAGFAPLTRITRVPDDSQNKDVLKAGDVFVRIADVPYPRQSQVHETLQKHKGKRIDITVLRDGEQTPVSCEVNRDGQLRVEIRPADDLLITAQPIAEYARYKTEDPTKAEDVTSPAGRAGLFMTGGTQILEVDGREVKTWLDLRNALIESTLAARESSESTEIALLVKHPIAGSESEAVTLTYDAEEIRRLHQLAWTPELPGVMFEPLYTVRQGSPTQAIAMGFEETKKMVLMTYLTIDRLIRRSVGVDQLRGPVGIVHIGTKVLNEGFWYFLFFLGMISVNLAVINFLPLPIVDGGLFLFLVYEKLKGKPPPLAFQNAATVVGLMIIGTLFLVTFYNDVLRLFT